MRDRALDIPVANRHPCKLVPRVLKLRIPLVHLVNIVLVVLVALLLPLDDLPDGGVLGLLESELRIELVGDEDRPLEEGLEVLDALDDLGLLEEYLEEVLALVLLVP